MTETPSTNSDTSTDKTSVKTSVRPSIDRKLLDILVCPVTKSVLHYDHEAQELISYAAKVAYPIRESIPIMLIEEARELDEAELAKNKTGK